MSGWLAGYTGSHYSILWILQVLFVGAGLVKGFGFQLLSQGSTFIEWTLLVAGMPFIGPLILCAFAQRTALFKGLTTIFVVRCLAVAIIDVIATCLNVLAYGRAGVGVVSIVCAGMPAITAVCVFVWDRKIPSLRKAIAILGAIAGLTIVPLGEGDPLGRDNLLVGTGLCLSATLLNSIVYIAMEQAVSGASTTNGLNEEKSPFLVLFWQAFFGIAVIVFVLGARFTFVDVPPSLMSQERNWGYPMLMIGGTVQSVCWIELLHRVGSVATGLLQVGRSSLNVLLSAYFWCNTQSWHCLTPIKGLSASLVMGFIFMFHMSQ